MSRRTKWIRVAYCEDIPMREGREVAIGNRSVAVFHLGDKFLAVDNRCPHRGGPLADGIVSGESVVCPLHGLTCRTVVFKGPPRRRPVSRRLLRK
jgi:nitrite reductase/ring-hydroxylating ferredoxin subunit